MGIMIYEKIVVPRKIRIFLGALYKNLVLFLAYIGLLFLGFAFFIKKLAYFALPAIKSTVLVIRVCVNAILLIGVAILILWMLPIWSSRIHNSEKIAEPDEILKPGSYRFSDWAQKDRAKPLRRDLIIVTLSGGGIRAAAFAAATLNHLHKFTIDGRPVTDDIVFISSTSGGSIAAGFIAAHGFGNYQKFRDSFLTKHNTRDLIFSSLSWRLLYDRSSLFQDFLENRLDLNNLTFEKLENNPDRPYFVFNATDIGAGRPFRFTQAYFNLICSSLSDVRVSSAVAASAAFPFLLTDVELKNNWDRCTRKKHRLGSNYHVSAEGISEDRHRYDLSHAFDMQARPAPFRRPKYLHLADGGLVDNVGARSISEEIYIDEMSSLSLLIGPAGSNTGNIGQILFLEINARSEVPRVQLDENSGSPNFLTFVDIVTAIPIDQTTALSTTYATNEWQKLAALGGAYTTNGMLHVEVDFDLLPNEDLDRRNKLKKIGGGLDLDPSDLEAIELASWKLLLNNPCFQRFVGESKATAADFVRVEEKVWNGWPYGCMTLDGQR